MFDHDFNDTGDWRTVTTERDFDNHFKETPSPPEPAISINLSSLP